MGDMTYNLFLDDLRDPPAGDWLVVRSYEEACQTVMERGWPRLVSFDHDLGRTPSGELGKTGFDFAKFLVERDLEECSLPVDFQFVVHSANPIGAENIASYLRSYLRFKATPSI